MKFGKQIQRRQLDLPEYAASFVNYKALKKLIKHLSATPTLAAQNATVGSPGTVDPKVALRANKEVFFFRLEREIEKVNVFYVQKEAEFSLRLKTLLDKRRTIQARSSSTSKSTASFATLVEGFQQFDHDLNKLQQFVEINETAISKILKKWDKTSKSRTKELYLQRAVEIQPCFNRDVLRDLSDRATTSRLDLEAWAEGENIQYDTVRPADKIIGQRVGTEEGDIDLQVLQAMAIGNLTSLQEWIARLQNSPHPKERFTRLFLASINDATDDADGVLLETGRVDLHAEDDINERNCLHEAAIYGREYVLDRGLQAGVDVSRVDVYGRLPLHYACLKGRVSMVKKLMEANEQTIDYKDHDNFTPLIHSIVRKQLACVHELISHGAQINPLTAADHIPLNLACQHESLEVASLLLQNGASLLPDAEGLYPQHVVAKVSQSADLLMLLKDHGANLDQQDRLYQWTPLFHAASEGRIECLRTLLQNGVNVGALDEKGLSPMYYAIWEGHLECMEQLWQRTQQSRQQSSALVDVPMTPAPDPSSSAEPLLSQKAKEADGIPDLSLPPPIIPLRRYGHNFLDTKALILVSFPPGVEAITFFNEGRYPAARITISSKSSDLIPRNIMLPMQEDARNVSFQIDGLDTFTVDFEVFPTFGSKVIAKSVALPDVFKATESSSGACCLPLFDPRLRAIGQIRFSCQVIQPYYGDPLDITHFATYWKATGALDDQNGLVTGSSLTGDYMRLFVQLTRDAVPVLYPKPRLKHYDVEIPISQLTYAELQRAVAKDIHSWRALFTEINSRPEFPTREQVHRLNFSTLSLQDILSNLRADIHLNLQVIYPTRREERSLRLMFNADINTFADAILTNVFDHARLSRQQDPNFMRSIVFSSKNLNICTALNWKQPNYPVVLCNDLLQPRESGSVRAGGEAMFGPTNSLSIKESARMAQGNNFMGLMIQSRVLEMVPALVDTVKEMGLVLVVDTSANDAEPANGVSKEPFAMPDGVNGILKSNGTLRFHDTVDM